MKMQEEKANLSKSYLNKAFHTLPDDHNFRAARSHILHAMRIINDYNDKQNRKLRSLSNESDTNTSFSNFRMNPLIARKAIDEIDKMIANENQKINEIKDQKTHKPLVQTSSEINLLSD